MSGAKEEGKQKFARRDQLLQIQASTQKLWEERKVFEADAPADGIATAGKFYGNFPYPYMNGLLHLGHAFSLSKLEFASAYHRLCGRAVLFPQGFHCTGMPIKACADKLKYEIEAYGNPPQFPDDEAVAPTPAPSDQQPAAEPTKFSGKKSKLAAKTGKATSQWEIMKMSGIPEEEIPNFQDPLYWLEYFPRLAERDMRSMGCGVDWRRSFITTDVNPYYDAFVRWQFNTLHKQGRIIKDKRYAVFSPKDGQPCADHDRASGEGVGPQEYTLIKMEVVEMRGKLSGLSGVGVVFLMAATLRPETMYGQTNCWVLPSGEYGAFQGGEGEVYVMTVRSALNLSYQEQLPITGQPECLMELTGQDLIGLGVKSPHCPLPVVYVLPMLTILTNKGTGIVTSVPSDSPDDYACLMDLKKKSKLREKFGVQDEWVLPFEVIPIIDIPGFGNKAAEKVCIEAGIQSQNDAAKLAEAKQMVYLKGFTDGVLEVGPYAGQKVSKVKAVIRDEMIAAGVALPYCEPERPVVSRSGEECVVALTDQWYITYGEDEWAALTSRALQAMQLYADECKHGFEHTLSWLKQWACSRSFGLGSRVPWDPQYLIESLSDSTIYMAFYTVAHILQSGDMYGRSSSPNIPPQHLTDEVWSYILLDGPLPHSTQIPSQMLEKMRNEFLFWYPFDVRVSGKDLIQNHLTFCLYTHTALWPQDKWPKAFRCNGHLMLNSEKMSKSTGNFKTLQQAIQEYSADGMRAALADAGDALDDANFEEATANSAILRLTKELLWIEETLDAVEGMRDQQPTSFIDRAFDNQINVAVHATKKAYDSMMFREALKCGWYDFQKARDSYRFGCGPLGMNRRLICRYIEVSTLLLSPICPHTCEHIWSHMLKKGCSVVSAGWPLADDPDMILHQACEYLDELIPNIRASIMKAESPKAKKGQKPQKMKVPHADLLVSTSFDGWKAEVLTILASKFDVVGCSFPEDTSLSLMSSMSASSSVEGRGQKEIKTSVMPFAKYKMDRALKFGKRALDVKLLFDEAQLLRDNEQYLLRSLGLSSISIHDVSDPQAQAIAGDRLKNAAPGEPVAVLKIVPAE